MAESCRICGGQGELEVHHKLPQRLGGAREGWNTVELCRSCHQKIEQIYPPEFWHNAFSTYAAHLKREEALASLGEEELPKCDYCGRLLTPEEVRAGAHRCTHSPGDNSNNREPRTTSERERTPSKRDGEEPPNTAAKTWLKPGQVKAIRSACLSEAFPTYLQQRNYAAVTVLADTGLRVSELTALDVDDLHLDAERPHIYLPSSKQKGRPGDATVYLDDYGDTYSARDTLKQFLAGRWKEPESDAVFPSRQDDRMTNRSVQRVVKQAANAAGVVPQVKSTAYLDGDDASADDVTPHTFRHSVAYRIIVQEGGRLEDVQRHLRHTSRETTDRVYSHLL